MITTYMRFAIRVLLISIVISAIPTYSNAASTPVNKNTKQIALTFDDGPDLKYTPEILKILAKYKINATFFVLGKQMQRYPEMTKKIASAGHVLANHTWSHRQLKLLSDIKIAYEIRATNQLIFKLTGQKNHLFRPPYGAISPSQRKLIQKQGYQLSFWNVDTRDWSGNLPNAMLNIVKRQLRHQSVILMHCYGGDPKNANYTVETLNTLIPVYLKRGYQFVTISQLPVPVKLRTPFRQTYAPIKQQPKPMIGVIHPIFK